LSDVIERVTALERDILQLNLHQREERKSDEEIDGKVRVLKDYINTQIADLSKGFDLKLQHQLPQQLIVPP
jgi:hypothetical protein